MADDALLRTPVVAKRLGVSVREVIEMLDDGRLPRMRSEENHLVVPESAVAALEASIQQLPPMDDWQADEPNRE